MGTYGYKDGQGNDRYDNTAVDEFWSDFKTMETYYRKPGPALHLAETAARIGGPNISCKSNFNKTRAAGEMHQHTWALAMMVAIRTLEETDPGDHSFKVLTLQSFVQPPPWEDLFACLLMPCSCS